MTSSIFPSPSLCCLLCIFVILGTDFIMAEGELSDDKFRRLVQQAKDIGLDKPLDIQKYVENQLAREEKIREKLAKEKQQEAERIAKEKQLEAERVEKEKRLEAERVEKERHLEAEHKKEIEFKRLELESHERVAQARLEEETKWNDDYNKARIAAEKAKTSAIERESDQRLRFEQERHVTNRDEAASGESRPHSRGYYPKLPIFNPATDDIDSFIYRFETHATACKWPPGSWVINFAATLQGEPLSFFQLICSAGLVTFEELKEHFLGKYMCTADGFRERLRKARPNTGESFTAFFTRLRHMMTRWIDLSATPKTFDGLLNLLLTEQALQSVCKDLRDFLIVREFEDVKEMCKYADRWRGKDSEKSYARQDKGNLFVASYGQDTQGQSNQQFGRGRGRRGTFQQRGSFTSQHRGGMRGGHTPQFKQTEQHFSDSPPEESSDHEHW